MSLLFDSEQEGKSMGHFVLALYEVDRAYGGPEEGGWYYDCGELRRPLRVFANESAAYAAARRCNEWLRVLQRDCRSVGSVLYRGGRYAAQVFERIAPEHYPVQRPHYE
jgi:hypothetical protein